MSFDTVVGWTVSAQDLRFHRMGDRKPAPLVKRFALEEKAEAERLHAEYKQLGIISCLTPRFLRPRTRSAKKVRALQQDFGMPANGMRRLTE